LKTNLSELEKRAGRWGMFAIVFALEAAWAASLNESGIALLSMFLAVLMLTTALCYVLGVGA